MFGLFFVVALLHSMVGFGGGSSYIALMVLFEVPYEVLPKIALVCNIIVVGGGSYHFIKKGHFRWDLFWPFILGSIPLSFLGGITPISKEIFLIILGGVLLFSGLNLFCTTTRGNEEKVKPTSIAKKISVGAIIGFISGLVGIGGGILLSPLLLNMRWGGAKSVTGVASVFILVNSIFGVFGQFLKSGTFSISGFDGFLALFLAVFLGGQIGSQMSAGKLSPYFVRLATAGLVIFVGGRLIFSYFARSFFPGF